jgi:hypothetical protein
MIESGESLYCSDFSCAYCKERIRNVIINEDDVWEKCKRCSLLHCHQSNCSINSDPAVGLCDCGRIASIEIINTHIADFLHAEIEAELTKLTKAQRTMFIKIYGDIDKIEKNQLKSALYLCLRSNK